MRSEKVEAFYFSCVVLHLYCPKQTQRCFKRMKFERVPLSFACDREKHLLNPLHHFATSRQNPQRIFVCLFLLCVSCVERSNNSDKQQQQQQKTPLPQRRRKETEAHTRERERKCNTIQAATRINSNGRQPPPESPATPTSALRVPCLAKAHLPSLRALQRPSR